MKTRTIATIVVFAALSIALNLLSPIRIPAPYAPFLIYQIWEIPIVAAFLLYGALAGSMIAVLNTVVLLAVFPGELPTGPFYNLAAILSMFLGIIVAQKISERYPDSFGDTSLGIMVTSAGIFLRTVAMALVNWVFLRFDPPVGFSLPETAILAYVPLVILFNATLALYTIPSGYVLAKAVKSGMEMA